MSLTSICVQSNPRYSPCHQGGATRSRSDPHRTSTAAAKALTPYVERSTGVPCIQSRAHAARLKPHSRLKVHHDQQWWKVVVARAGGTSSVANARTCCGLSSAVSSPCIGFLANAWTAVGTSTSARVLQGNAARLCWRSHNTFIRVHVPVSLQSHKPHSHHGALHCTEQRHGRTRAERRATHTGDGFQN